MMLAFLLARAGVDVLLLEKHADFLRDFRGDTIHPSTLEIMHELQLLDEFLKLPHQELKELRAHVGDRPITIADFRHLPTRCRFIALIPQWDFLDFLVDHAREFPQFRLMMNAEVTNILEESGHVVGVQANTPEGLLEVTADLVVGADGRHSIVRDKAGFTVEEFGAPMDVLWFRISRSPQDPELIIRFDVGRIFVSINRDTYWQCGYVIPKGQVEEVRKRGLEFFRESVKQLAPHFKDRVNELRTWEDVRLLTVRIDRLVRWFRPGLLCIGDAAHAMSPVGGVGINLAIQDAVAAANILAQALREANLSIDLLEQIQKRREFPTRVTQRLQLFLQRNLIWRALSETRSFKPPFALRLLGMFPVLRRIPARIIGLGVRPEHVRTAKVH